MTFFSILFSFKLEALIELNDRHKQSALLCNARWRFDLRGRVMVLAVSLVVFGVDSTLVASGFKGVSSLDCWLGFDKILEASNSLVSILWRHL